MRVCLIDGQKMTASGCGKNPQTSLVRVQEAVSSTASSMKFHEPSLCDVAKEVDRFEMATKLMVGVGQ